MRKAVSQPRRVKVEGDRGIYYRPRTSPVVYEITWTENGRQHWRTIEGGLREARAARGNAVAKLSRGERVARTKLTLGEYAETWIETQESRLRPKTLRTYRDHLRLHIVPKLGKRKLASITVDDVAILVADLNRHGLAPWTQRGILTVLSRLLGSAARSGLVPTNVVAQLDRSERPRVKRVEFPSLDREAVGRLILATPTKYRALVVLSVLIGLRQGEALGLRWRDVDTAAGLLHVRHQHDGRTGELVEPKTEAAKRSIPLAPSLAKMLAAHRLASPFSGESDFVFCSSSGRPLQARNITRRGLSVGLAVARLPHLRWHDLRHVAASLLIAEGASVGHVSRLLGHANPSVTLSTYAHAFAAAEHDALTRERMEAAFGDVLFGGTEGSGPIRGWPR